MSRVQNVTRKIVKPKDITEGIARMMVLDLRPFDIVEGVGFNELFILVTNSFPNPNSFGNSDSFENPDKFDNLEIFGYPSRSRRNFVFPTRYFGFSHTSTYYLTIREIELLRENFFQITVRRFKTVVSLALVFRRWWRNWFFNGGGKKMTKPRM